MGECRRTTIHRDLHSFYSESNRKMRLRTWFVVRGVGPWCRSVVLSAGLPESKNHKAIISGADWFASGFHEGDRRLPGAGMHASSLEEWAAFLLKSIFYQEIRTHARSIRAELAGHLDDSSGGCSYRMPANRASAFIPLPFASGGSTSPGPIVRKAPTPNPRRRMSDIDGRRD